MFVNYREPELENLVSDQESSDQWKELIAQLGMEGQQELLMPQSKKAKEVGRSGEPIPYMPINKRWMKIFKTLCPDKSDLKSYKFSTVPLDGLAEIALCKEKQYFDKIEIWYDNVEKDPLIVGVLDAEYSSDKRFFLIGRFGDEVLPFEVLEKKAIQRLTAYLKNEVNKVTKTIDECVTAYLDKDENVCIEIRNALPHQYYW